MVEGFCFFFFKPGAHTRWCRTWHRDPAIWPLLFFFTIGGGFLHECKFPRTKNKNNWRNIKCWGVCGVLRDHCCRLMHDPEPAKGFPFAGAQIWSLPLPSPRRSAGPLGGGVSLIFFLPSSSAPGTDTRRSCWVFLFSTSTKNEKLLPSSPCARVPSLLPPSSPNPTEKKNIKKNLDDFIVWRRMGGDMIFSSGFWVHSSPSGPLVQHFVVLHFCFFFFLHQFINIFCFL